MKNEARKKSTALVKSNGDGVEKSYAAWIADLKRRYRATQIKAAVAVNSALIEFYWNLGKDIAEKFAEEARYGSRFFEKVSFDMRAEFPNDSGFSPRNIRYCQDFYRLYSAAQILPQVDMRLTWLFGARALPFCVTFRGCCTIRGCAHLGE